MTDETGSTGPESPDPASPEPASPEPASPEPGEHDGPGVVNASFAGTGVLLFAAVVGVLSPDSFGSLTAVVSGVLFTVGVVAFLWGYANGVVRSRDEKVTLGGLFFLAHTAPKVVRIRLRGALIVQIIAATVAASVRPYTSVAFAVLAPMYGLGLMALWGARYGMFFAKDDGTDG